MYSRPTFFCASLFLSMALSTFLFFLPLNQVEAHLLRPALASTNWPQFGFNAANSRFNNKETTLSPTNVSQLVQAWSKPVGTGYGATSPAVVKGVVYITNGSELYALKASTGKMLWSINTGDSGSLAAPAVANGLIYLGVFTGGSSGTLNAYSTTNGALVWQTTTPNDIPYNVPTVANGVVYAGGNSLYAFNATTGALLWSGDIHHDDYAPAVVNGVVYEDTYFGEVAAFSASGCNPSPCEPIWTAQTSNLIYYNAEPVVANGIVYVTCTDDKLYAFKASSGKLLWTATTGAEIIDSPAYANGTVYVGSTDNKLYAFNARTGATIWTSLAYGQFASSPAVANGVVYIGNNNGNLYAFNATTGATLWSAATGPGSLTTVSSSPVISNGVVYVASSITDTGSDALAFKLPA